LLLPFYLSQFDIGCIYSTISDYASALSNFQKCLLRRRRLLGDHVDVANTLYEIATVHYNTDNTDLAIDCLTESDRIWKVKLTSSEKLSTVLLPSANLWKSLQAYEAAEKNFEQALECAIDLHGKDHELVASIFLRFGEFLHEINQIQQATFCFDEAIRVRTLIFGENSPNVAQVEYSKGVALLFHGDFVDASSCLNRALTIRQETLGHQHAEVGDTLNTIGFLHLRMGNFSGDEALDPLMRSLEIRRAIGNKSKIVTTLQNMASVYKRRKEFDSYLEMHVEILTVRQAQFGCNDARVADAWVQVGNILVSLGRLEEATVSYEEALRVQTHLHGPNHTSVARILFKFGSLYSKQNKFTEAKDMLEEYTRIRATEVDDPDGEMAKALTMLGDLQKEAGEKSKAQINWTSAMNIYQQLNYPEDHPKLFKLRERQKTISFVDSSWNSIDLSWRSVGDFATRQDSGLGGSARKGIH
jgi:tetratricopeptide (TPR) repeat protein